MSNISSNPYTILRDIFGFNEFKPQQIEIITRILNNEGDTLGIMPTGGGKTLCFQIPAFIQNNLTIVVSPLIALMKDQIDNLKKNGIDSVFYINSSLNNDEKENILSLVETGKVKLLYIAPESLKSEKILESLQQSDIDLFVIDEAHCISTWGHNFRPDYLTLPKIIKRLNNPQILALTATATKEVEEDIQQQLKTKCKVFKSSFNRPNLYIEAIQLADNVKKIVFLLDLLKKLNGPTIIFVTFQKSAENLSNYLNENGVHSIFYHGGIKNEEKEERQNIFMSGKCDIIVTTIAFGMGIDKSNIRNIIHYNISQSIESYYQEIGRAGRDNDISNCITLFSEKDETRLQELISSGWPDDEAIEEMLFYLINKDSNYFFASDRKISMDCKIGDTSTKLILQKLEEHGAIKIFNNVIYRISPQFNKSPAEMIKENPKYAIELEGIFSCDFFKNNLKTWLDIENVMGETGLNYFKIKEVLEHLRVNGSLIYFKMEHKNLIWVRDAINTIDATPLIDYFNGILNNNLLKVELLSQNLTIDGCIRKNILNYFDETNLKDNCGMCSHCVGDKLTAKIERIIDKNYATDKEINEIDYMDIDYINDTPLMILLKSLIKGKKVSPNNFVKNYKNDLSKSSKYDGASHELDIIEEAIKKQLVIREIDGSLRITKMGIKCILENKYDIQNFKDVSEEAKVEEVKEVEVEKTDGNISDFNQNEIAYIVIRCVAKLDHAIGKNRLAEMLTGSKSKKIDDLKLNKNQYYGQLSIFSKNQILDIIIQMKNSNYLSVTQQSNSSFSRPVLIVTDKGIDAIMFQEDILLDLLVEDKKGTILYSKNEEILYDKLRDYRKKIVLEKKIPSYCVFNDNTLKIIANEKPDNYEDLKKIKGIGDAKLEQYGKNLIEIVTADFYSKAIETHEFTTNCQEHNLPPSQTKSQNKNHVQN